jgi:hypothetical protein
MRRLSQSSLSRGGPESHWQVVSSRSRERGGRIWGRNPTWARQREGEADGWATMAPRAHAAATHREASGFGLIRKGKMILNFRIRFSNNAE